ncbi:CbbQ/NirQ/NorQ/GpvN family protein [Achromobacter sp. F4_2707]|uniref:CbbQ/NirQ/NorQ/GpvN family protein n=1 Tax=Achromobacter sp. F4_2707 TaxID=3114286 RepID=UPI0039C6AAA2
MNKLDDALQPLGPDAYAASGPQINETQAKAAQLAQDGLRPPPDIEPYYLATHDEIQLFELCHENGLAVMLKGPTGCGKTRFVEHMAWKLQRPLVTVSCHDDLSASDLIGRYLIHHDSVQWQDGPLTTAARLGAICYLDEIVEARQDTIVVLHSLTDHRRTLTIDKTGEVLEAAPGFQMVISYNPGYQRMMKDLKPSTRQRFVALDFDFPAPDHEAGIVAHEGGISHQDAQTLVALAGKLRAFQDRGLAEAPSTRLLVATAQLMKRGIGIKRACQVALVSPLSDDAGLLDAMNDLLDLSLA